MRKLQSIVSVLILLAMGVPGRAQMTLGPKVGLNLAGQFKSNYTIPKLDIAYGVALDIPVSKVGLSVQGEVLLTNKGYREEYNGKEVFDQLTATYLEIPAMLKYSNMGVNWGFFGSAGVYWGFWNRAEYQSSIDGQEITTELYTLNTSFDQDGYRDVRSDFGGVIEIGMTYDNLGSGILALGVRYSHGFRPTGEYQNPPVDFVEKKNQVLTVSLTYFLYL